MTDEERFNQMSTAPPSDEDRLRFERMSARPPQTPAPTASAPAPTERDRTRWMGAAAPNPAQSMGMEEFGLGRYVPANQSLSEYMRSSQGRFLMPAVGAALGQALIPVPGVGAGVGAAVAGGIGAGGAELAREVVGGEEISPGKIGYETLLPGAAGGLLKGAGAAVRWGAQKFPGAGVALQKHVMDRVRDLLSGIPRPPAAAPAQTLATETAEQAAERAATSAAYDRLAEVSRQAQLAERVKEMQAIPKGLPREKGIWGEDPAAQALAALQTGQAGAALTTAPVASVNLLETLPKVAQDLAPVIERWRLSENLALRQSAAALEKVLKDAAATGTNMTVHQYQRFLQTVGPLTRGKGIASGAADQLYKAAMQDLQTAAAQEGGNAAATVLKAGKEYRRYASVERLARDLQQAVKVGEGGTLEPAPGALLKKLMSPPTEGTAGWEGRMLKESLTPEEYADIISRLQQAIRPTRPIVRPNLEAPPPTHIPATPRVRSIQEIAEGAIKPVKGVPGAQNVAVERILAELPRSGAMAETPTQTFLRGVMPETEQAFVRQGLEQLQGLPQATAGQPGFLERLFPYSIVSGLVTAAGGTLMGAGGGASALAGMVQPAAILASQQMVNALRSIAASPAGQKAILAAFRNRLGTGEGTRLFQSLMAGTGGTAMTPPQTPKRQTVRGASPRGSRGKAK